MPPGPKPNPIQDTVGIVAKLSECIASRGGNIHSVDVFVPDDKPVFYSRRLGSTVPHPHCTALHYSYYILYYRIVMFALLCGTAFYFTVTLEFGSEFTFNPRLWPRHEIHNDFLNLSHCFNAQTSTVRVPDLDPKYNISILASKQVWLLYLLASPRHNNYLISFCMHILTVVICSLQHVSTISLFRSRTTACLICSIDGKKAGFRSTLIVS